VAVQSFEVLVRGMGQLAGPDNEELFVMLRLYRDPSEDK
jgi:hypothetical protein